MSYNRPSRFVVNGGNRRHGGGQRNYGQRNYGQRNNDRGGINGRHYKNLEMNNLWDERTNSATSRSFRNECYSQQRNFVQPNVDKRLHRNNWFSQQEQPKADNIANKSSVFEKDYYQNEKSDIVGEIFRRVTQPSVGHCVRDVDERTKECNFGTSHSNNTDFVGEVFRKVTGSNNDVNVKSKMITVGRDDVTVCADERDSFVDCISPADLICDKEDWQNMSNIYSKDYEYCNTDEDNAAPHQFDDMQLMTERHPFELPSEPCDSSVPQSTSKNLLLPPPTLHSLPPTHVHSLLPPPVQTLLPPPPVHASLPLPVQIQNVTSVPMPVPPPVPPGILSALKNRGMASTSVPNSSLLNSSYEVKDNSVCIETTLLSLSNLQQQLVSNLAALKENNPAPATTDLEDDVVSTAVTECSTNLKRQPPASNIVSSASDVSLSTSTPFSASMSQTAAVDMSAITSEEKSKSDIVLRSEPSQENKKRKTPSLVKDVAVKGKIQLYLNTFMQDYHDRVKVVAIMERDVSKLRQDISAGGGNVREHKLDLIRMEAELRTAKDSLKQLKITGENYLTKELSKSNESEVLGDQKAVMDNQDPTTSRAATLSKKWLELRQIWHRDLYRLKKDRDYVPFEYRDLGRHWCRLCNHTSRNLREHLHHLHDENHWKYFDKEHKPWVLPTPIGSFMNKIPMKMGPMKGVEFIVPAKSFMCSICKDLFMETSEIVDHMNSKEHHERYKEFVTKNPHYERAYNLDKQAGVQRERIESRQRIINEQSERDHECDAGTERGPRAFLDREADRNRHLLDRYRDRDSMDRLHESDHPYENRSLTSSDRYRDRDSLDRFHESDHPYENRSRTLSDRYRDRDLSDRLYESEHPCEDRSRASLDRYRCDFDHPRESDWFQDRESELHVDVARERNLQSCRVRDRSIEHKASPQIRGIIEDSLFSSKLTKDHSPDHSRINLEPKESPSDLDSRLRSKTTPLDEMVEVMQHHRATNQAEESGESTVTKDPLKMRSFKKKQSPSEIEELIASKGEAQNDASERSKALHEVSVKTAHKSGGGPGLFESVDSRKRKLDVLAIDDTDDSLRSLAPAAKRCFDTVLTSTTTKKEKEFAAVVGDNDDDALKRVKKSKKKEKSRRNEYEDNDNTDLSSEKKRRKRHQQKSTKSSTKKDVDFDDFLRDIVTSSGGGLPPNSASQFQITSVLSLPNLPVAAADYGKCVVVLDRIAFRLRKGSCLARDAEYLVEQITGVKSTELPEPLSKKKAAFVRSKKKMTRTTKSCLKSKISRSKDEDSFTDSLSSLSSETDDDGNTALRKVNKKVKSSAPVNSYSDSDTSVSELLQRSKRKSKCSPASTHPQLQVKSQICASFSGEKVGAVEAFSAPLLLEHSTTESVSHVELGVSEACTLVRKPFESSLPNSSPSDIVKDFFVPPAFPLEHCAAKQELARDADSSSSQSNVNKLNDYCDSSLFEHYEIEPLSADMIHVLDILEVEDAIDLY